MFLNIMQPLPRNIKELQQVILTTHIILICPCHTLIQHISIQSENVLKVQYYENSQGKLKNCGPSDIELMTIFNKPRNFWRPRYLHIFT